MELKEKIPVVYVPDKNDRYQLPDKNNGNGTVTQDKNNVNLSDTIAILKKHFHPHLFACKGYSSYNRIPAEQVKDRYDEAKTPCFKGWQKESITLEDAEKWIRQNGWMGMLIPEGFILVDIDNKETGKACYEQLRNNGYKFLCFETPNGYQLLFRDTGKVKNQQVKFITLLGIPVDYRLSKKGYIVFPTENTEGRSIVYSPDTIDNMTDLFMPVRRYLPEKDSDKVLSLPIGSGERNDSLLRHTARLREWAAKYTSLNIDVRKTITDINNIFCEPPIGDREIETILNSAMSYQTNSRPLTSSQQQSIERADTIRELQETSAQTLQTLCEIDYTPAIDSKYCIADGNISKIVKNKDNIDLIPFSKAFVITAKIITENDSKIVLKNAEKHEVIIDIHFADIKTFEQTMSNFLGMPFTASGLKDTREYIVDFYHRNERNLKEIHGLTRTGWHNIKNEKVFVLPTTTEGKDNLVWMNDEIEKGIKAKGKDISDNGFLRDIIMAPAGKVVLASLSAPLLDALGCGNFAVNVTGLTGTGKTTAAKIATSLWGDPGALMRTWFGTKNGWEGYAEMYQDLPVWFDEVETAGKNLSDAVDFIYQFCSGKGKTRRNKNLDLRKTAEFKGVLITTAEKTIDSIVSSLKDTRTQPLGLFRRVFEIKADENFLRVYNTDRKLDPAEIHKFIDNNFGEFGKKWVNFLNSSEFKENVFPIYKYILDDIADAECQGMEQIYAALCIAVWILECLDILSTENDDINYLTYEILLKDAKEKGQKFKKITDIIEKFEIAVTDYYSMNLKHWEGESDNPKRDGLWGAKKGTEKGTDKKDLFILTSAFGELCKKEGFVQEQIIDEMDKRGRLKKTEPRKTYRGSLSGNRCWGYYITNIFETIDKETNPEA